MTTERETTPDSMGQEDHTKVDHNIIIGQFYAPRALLHFMTSHMGHRVHHTTLSRKFCRWQIARYLIHLFVCVESCVHLNHKSATTTTAYKGLTKGYFVYSECWPVNKDSSEQPGKLIFGIQPLNKGIKRKRDKTREKAKLPKIMAYLSCSAGRTHFSRTNT